MAFVLNNARHFNIADGSTDIAHPELLGILYKQAAPDAILNARGRTDEVRCHPGTREAILGRIESWRDAQDSQTPPILWLSGPAGAGKTAIVQTIAERCNAQGIPQVNFFFFRTDATRNGLAPLIATLVHQLILLYPRLRDLVVGVVSSNPLIFSTALENQLAELIVAPLRTINQTSLSNLSPLLLIDGLDECDSAEKRSQQQIVQAFDRIFTEHHFPFRLLIASRDESHIRVAFNTISSQLLSVYLDDQYEAENDIRAFVVDAFQRIRKVHPLAHTLPISWPSGEDVESIVQKSSGQFIYAASVMHFIMISSANPALSLARIQGVSRIHAGSKSPFVRLDAMYTSVLSRVADQQMLKTVLHAQLLIQVCQVDSSPGILFPLLEVCSSHYTPKAVQSCLAEVLPIAQYVVKDQKMVFHHASFPDYLLDSSRSAEYFVDLHAFNFGIQPEIWKARRKWGWSDTPKAFHDLASRGMARLEKLPPGLLDAMIALAEEAFMHESNVSIFHHLHSLCTRDEDVIKYKRILKNWAKAHVVEFENIEASGTNWPPYAWRYIVMSCIDNDLGMKTHDWNILDHLRPETAAEDDVREISLWLSKLLHDIYVKTYHTNTLRYNQLVRKWTSWAAQNDISLAAVDDLPNALWYRAMADIERNFATDVTLHREKDCDVAETTAWLTTLLRRIHRAVYSTSARRYNQLIQKWTSWAVQNEVPLGTVDDLPNARWYSAMANIERDITADIALHREKDCDVPETTAWLANLLRRIHEETYRDGVDEYNRLVQKWVLWATLNDIPLDGVDSFPRAQRYRAIAYIEHNPRTEPLGWIDIALRPATDYDARETAAWIRELLHRTFREKHFQNNEAYNHFLQKWITWATWNNVRLHGVYDLPKAWWHLPRSRVKRGVTKLFGFGRHIE